MKSTIGAKGRFERWAAIPVAWLLLTRVVTGVTALFGAPAAGAQGAVSGVHVTLSSPAAGATEVTYLVRFTTSATGALAAGAGTITVTAAPGTVFPTCDSVTDLKTGATSDACTTGGAKPSSTVTLVSEIAIAGGDTVLVTLNDVTNPAKPPSSIRVPIPPHSSSTMGGGRSPNLAADFLEVRTSSDGPRSTVYALVKQGHLSEVSVARSTISSRATGVTYTYSFKTSVSGGLTPNGTITIGPLGGLDAPTCGWVKDLTTGKTSDSCGSYGRSNSIVVLPTEIPIGAGDKVQVQLSDMTNPNCGVSCLSALFSVKTSSDLALPFMHAR